MYSAHRGAPPGPPGNRLADLLEQIRQEFEGQANRANEHEHAREYSIVPGVGSCFERVAYIFCLQIGRIASGPARAHILPFFSVHALHDCPESYFRILKTLSDPCDRLVHAQVSEFELVRSKIFQLDQTHQEMKRKYVVLSHVSDLRVIDRI